MNERDGFIDTLMQETFEVADMRGSAAPTNVCYLSTESIAKSLKEKYITFWSGYYSLDSQTFKIEVNHQTLDFPRNWSIFSKLYQAIREKSDIAVTLCEHEDHDKLFSLMSQIFDTTKFYFVIINSELLLVADSFGDSTIENILDEYGVQYEHHLDMRKVA